MLVEEGFQRLMLQYDRVFTGEPSVFFLECLAFLYLTLYVRIGLCSRQDAELPLAAYGPDLQGQCRVRLLPFSTSCRIAN